MERDTKASLIENAASILGVVGKEVFINRQERKMEELRAENEKELVELRSGQRPSTAERVSPPETNESGRANQSVVNSLTEASSLVNEVDDALALAENAEECEVCRRLIRAARQKPVRKQRSLLPELRDFLASVEDDTPQDELVAQLEESPELMDLLEDELPSGVGGSSRGRSRDRSERTSRQSRFGE